jgi:hypothetical protein
MENLLNKLLESAKENKKGLILLKNTAVTCQNYELASNLRELEKTLFPVTETQKSAKDRAKHLNLIFRMVGLNIAEKQCWIIEEALKGYNKKKGKFGIDDASKIEFTAAEYFD